MSSFATQYVAMTAPLIGTFTSNGVSTGVVEVRSQAGGPVTSVNVAEVTGDGTWWVLSASTPQIIVTVPANLDTVLSPIAMSGQSTAFEAVVNVTVRADGSLAPLATNTVMGGSMGAMGPFAKSIPFAVTAATDGAVMFREISPRDSRYIEATVVRVHF